VCDRCERIAQLVEERDEEPFFAQKHADELFLAALLLVDPRRRHEPAVRGAVGIDARAALEVPTRSRILLRERGVFHFIRLAVFEGATPSAEPSPAVSGRDELHRNDVLHGEPFTGTEAASYLGVA